MKNPFPVTRAAILNAGEFPAQKGGSARKRRGADGGDPSAPGGRRSIRPRREEIHPPPEGGDPSAPGGRRSIRPRREERGKVSGG